MKAQWSRFDIVISMDITVGPEIIRRYKSVLWMYYVTEGCMSSADKSLEIGPAGRI